MIFNPLFISSASTANELGKSKFANPNYLFTDIINVTVNKSDFGGEEAKTSFNSLLGVAGNSNNFIISSSSSESMNESALKGYKLNEKEIGGVLTELLKNSDSVEVYNNDKLIYKDNEPGNNVFQILQKLLAELGKGENISLNLISGDSNYSVELQGINGKDISNNAREGFLQAGSKFSDTAKSADKIDSEFLSALQGLLSNKQIIDQVKENLSDENAKQLEKLIADSNNISELNNFLLANPVVGEAINEALQSNKEVVLNEMNEIIKSSSSHNLNPEEINKLNHIASYILEDKDTRLPEILKFLQAGPSKSDSSPTKDNSTLTDKLESVFNQASKSREISSELISELDGSTIQSLIASYEGNPDFKKSDGSVVQENSINTTADVMDVVAKGRIDMKQLVPELQGFLDLIDSKELLNSLMSDKTVSEILKERIAGLLSKVDTADGGELTSNSTYVKNVESELLSALESSGKNFTPELNNIIKQYDLGKPAKDSLLAKSDSLKPILKEVISKLTDTDASVKQLFERILNSGAPEIHDLKANNGLSQEVKNNVNSTLENFLKIVAAKSSPAELDSEAGKLKPEALRNMEFMLKISNSDDTDNNLNELTKLITKEDSSTGSDERKIAKLIENNLSKTEPVSQGKNPHKSGSSSSDEKASATDKQSLQKNGNDFKQIEDFMKPASIKRSLGDAKMKSPIGQNVAGKSEVADKNQLKTESNKSAIESGAVKTGDNSTVVQSDNKQLNSDLKAAKDEAVKSEAVAKEQSDSKGNSGSDTGSEGKHGGETQKSTTSASLNSAKSGAGVDRGFASHMKSAHQNTENIQKRIDVIKNVELNRVNNELKNIVSNRTSQNVTLRLNPATLGEVDIAIEIIKNTVNARIEVENESVRQVVNSGIEQLKQTLVQQGLQPQNINVSLTNQDDKNHKFTKNKKKNSGNKKFELENEIEVESPKNMGYNTYDYVA